MNIFYGAGPVPPDVMASSVDTLVVIRGKQALAFQGLTFMGSNGNAFYIADASHIRISSCRIVFSSLDGVDAIRSNDLVLDHLNVDHSNDNGISVSGTGNLVTDCVVRRSGTIPGMGNSEHSYIGINLGGSNNTVQYNTVDTTGYVGILFLGGPDTLRNNVIDYFCFIKDDGGGIYTWSGDIDSATARNSGVITGNILLNGITAASGTDNRQEGIANGIYLDENTMSVAVTGNSVAHCTAGIFVQDSHEVTVKGNTLFDNGAQISVRHALTKGTLKNNDISDNTAVAARKGEMVLLFSSGVSGEVGSFTRMKDNHYCESGGASFYRAVVRQDNKSVQDKGELADWQAKYGKDDHSQLSAQAGGVRFEYNPLKTVKSVSLDRTYKDPAGKVFEGQLRLEPYTSEVLIPQ
jgi:parallel beta-helix repeat protein